MVKKVEVHIDKLKLILDYMEKVLGQGTAERVNLFGD
jgi:hypothetical protein